MLEGMPQIELGQPIRVFANSGDVVLCHYQLAHSAAINLSANDRIAIYFRVWRKGIKNRRWELLTNIRNGWGCESQCSKILIRLARNYNAAAGCGAVAVG